jgi:hypothetical protein
VRCWEREREASDEAGSVWLTGKNCTRAGATRKGGSQRRAEAAGDRLCVLSKRYSRIGGARSWRIEGTEEQASKREGDSEALMLR